MNTPVSTRFIAINVGLGDAFFLERSGYTALVDGGRAKGFPVVFRRAVGMERVDVLVCTHNDADHANGVLAFLNSGYEVKECWLPGSWIEPLKHLIDDADDGLLRELLFEPEHGDKPLPERVPREGDVLKTADLEVSLDRAAEQDPILDGQLCNVATGIVVLRRHAVVAMGRQVGILLDAARIREIALAATRRQIPIKWFDIDVVPGFPPSGRLSVVNATEVSQIKRSALSRRDVVRLTQVNRDSLVLYSAPDSDAPGVLFCADSGFGFSASVPGDTGMIVTAPHHGSADAENANVYSRLAGQYPKEVGTWTWVRSDKGTRPGDSRPCNLVPYARSSVLCTCCRGTTSAGQDILFCGGRHPSMVYFARGLGVPIAVAPRSTLHPSAAPETRLPGILVSARSPALVPPPLRCSSSAVRTRRHPTKPTPS